MDQLFLGVEAAAQHHHGHLDIIQEWLSSINVNSEIPAAMKHPTIMNAAAQGGHLHVMQWLKTQDLAAIISPDVVLLLFVPATLKCCAGCALGFHSVSGLSSM